MAQFTQGFRFGHGENNSSFGSYAWTNPGFIAGDDGLYATNPGGLGLSGYTNYILTYDYGFSIPSGAIIKGIEVNIEVTRTAGGGSVTMNTITQLTKLFNNVGVAKTDPTSWPVDPLTTVISLGGSTDLWGVTWTAEEINDASFGLTFAFEQPGSASNGAVDYTTIKVHYDLPLNAQYSASNPYADGKLMYKEGTGAWTDIATSDLWFKTIPSPGSTTIAYTDADPSAVLADILTKYRADGGRVNYDSSTVESTGESIDYTFVLATTLEGVETVNKLGPTDWYWYVDPGTNYLHYHRKANTADHTLIMGQHITSFKPEYTIEEIRNLSYFSGGESSPGVNIFKVSSNAASIAKYGRRLVRTSDNRVTTDETGQLLADNEAAKNPGPIFRGDITVVDTYDINTINLGDTITVRNVDEFIDSFLLQVVGIRRYPTYVELNIGVLPIRNARRIEQIKRDLEKQQTINNPSAPA